MYEREGEGGHPHQREGGREGGRGREGTRTQCSQQEGLPRGGGGRGTNVCTGGHTSTDLPSSTMCLREGESAGAGVRRVTGGCTASKEGNSMERSCMRSRAGPMKRLYHCSRSEKKSDRGGCSASKDGGEKHDGVNRCPCRSAQLVGEIYSIFTRRVHCPCSTKPAARHSFREIPDLCQQQMPTGT